MVKMGLTILGVLVASILLGLTLGLAFLYVVANWWPVVVLALAVLGFYLLYTAMAYRE